MLGGDAAVSSIPLGFIPHPHSTNTHEISEIRQYVGVINGVGTDENERKEGDVQTTETLAALDAIVNLTSSATNGHRKEFKEQNFQFGVEEDSALKQKPAKKVLSPNGTIMASNTESETMVVLCDHVSMFDEISAAQGALGRFPGSEMMGVVKQFAGVVGA